MLPTRAAAGTSDLVGEADISEALDRAFAGKPGPRVIFNFDFDGPLGPIVDRSGHVANTDGTWDFDTEVPSSTLGLFHRLGRHAVNAIVTGGAALRAMNKVGARRNRTWVSGAEGAEFYDPSLRVAVELHPRPNSKCAAVIAGIIALVNERWATASPPKNTGSPHHTEAKGQLTNTWHPINVAVGTVPHSCQRGRLLLGRESGDGNPDVSATTTAGPSSSWSTTPTTP